MIADLLSEITLPAGLEQLDGLLSDELWQLDLWLYDYRMTNLRSLRTGAQGWAPDIRAGADWNQADISAGNEPAQGGRAAGVPGTGLRAALSHHGELLGFVTAQVPEGADEVESRGSLERLAPILAAAVTTSNRVDDAISITRRQRAMGLAAELQWSLLPPTRFQGARCMVSAAVEPAYETGGDLFDYALRDGHLLLAVLDAMGHGLQSALVSSVAVAALRRARRSGHALLEMASEVDEAVRSLGQQHFVSAVMADIDLATGRSAYLSAGHVPPLLAGAGDVRELELVATLPLGLRIGSVSSRPVVQPFTLEPGQALVLYSDGIIDNQLRAGDEPAGFERFKRLVSSLVPAGIDAVGAARPLHPARDVVDALLALTGPDLRDDATLLMAQTR